MSTSIHTAAGRGRAAFAAILAAAFALPLPALAQDSHAPDTYQQVEPVLKTTETVAGQPIVFPAAPNGVTAVIVTLGPGEATAWHRHDAPMFAYMLEGSLTVTYAGIGEKSYTAGAALMEAQQITHQGRNTGTGPVRILTVFLTGEGSVPTTMTEAPGK